MTKKILVFFIVLLISIFVMNICHATDVLTDSENASTTNVQTIDDTTYKANSTTEIAPNNEVNEPTSIQPISDYEQPAITTTDYDNSSELSVSNMINIVLIAVGIVLILLGIAIIIKLK